jgi:Luciferase-like monooxygenase
VEFGVYLPTNAWPDLAFEHAAQVREFARRAESLGFDALWVGEHFLVAGHYGTAWMAPLLCLAHAASVTSRIRLATGVLVLPYHHPVTLAREIQTLYHLSGGRLILGVGPGWDSHEFESIGLQLPDRGSRTDETLAILRRLLTEPDVSFEGRFFRFAHVTIAPLLRRFPELWVAGGSKLASPGSPDKPHLATSVHYNFVELVDTDDREEALRLQRPRFERMMGRRRPFEQLRQCYLMGTTQDIIERITWLERVGFRYLVFATLDSDAEQLERIASEIVARFRARPTAAGEVSGGSRGEVRH